MNNEVAQANDADEEWLSEAWDRGYSIAELWGFTAPVTRSAPLDAPHVMLWGILSIVEYQVSKGAGHRYLRDRLWNRDWIAIGFLEPKTEESRLAMLPPIKDAKFGRKRSAVGSNTEKYTDVRVVHAKLAGLGGGDEDAAQIR